MVLRLMLIVFLYSSSCFANDLISLNAKDFIESKPSFEREKIVNSLTSQFHDKNFITQKRLDELWNNQELQEKYMMARFQIIKQKVFADSYYIGHYYFPTLLKYFENLAKKYSLPDVDFIIVLREEIPFKEKEGELLRGYPLFIMFKDKDSSYEMDKIIFPDGFFLKNNYGLLLNNIEKESKKIKWEDKVEKIFWRGATTGDFYNYTIDNFDKLPRMTISVFSKLYPNLIDATFSAYSDQVKKEFKGKSLKEFCQILFGRKPGYVNEIDHLKYKYLLSLDGNAATGTRVAWIMRSNSVLLKQESNKFQWYYDALQPYVNYVPVNKRLTNIFEQIEWIKNHDNEVKLISQKAQDFILNNLQPEHIEAHVVILLNEYNKIQKDKEIVPTLTPAENVISFSSFIKMMFYKIKIYIKERISQW